MRPLVLELIFYWILVSCSFLMFRNLDCSNKGIMRKTNLDAFLVVFAGSDVPAENQTNFRPKYREALRSTDQFSS